MKINGPVYVVIAVIEYCGSCFYSTVVGTFKFQNLAFEALESYPFMDVVKDCFGADIIESGSTWKNFGYEKDRGTVYYSEEHFITNPKEKGTTGHVKIAIFEQKVV